jgi:hypothetical protein
MTGFAMTASARWLRGGEILVVAIQSFRSPIKTMQSL